MRTGVFFALLAAVVIATRLCHSTVLWADDNLPLAAAMEVARGKTLYRDVWFDKPPLVAWIDLLWGARAGIWLRLAGALYVIGVATAAWQFARTKWSEQEGFFAAGFFAFFLTFGLPSAVIPLASDMLLVLPHLLAAYFAWRGRAFLAGAAAGIGLLCSSKALFVLAACGLFLARKGPIEALNSCKESPADWLPRLRRSLPAAGFAGDYLGDHRKIKQASLLLTGFATPLALALVWMQLHGSASEYYHQTWQWGAIYAANTFVDRPFMEGLTRTANWAGFQAALVVGAIYALKRDRDWRGGAWIVVSFVGVVLGLRFFPRYYFLLLPPVIMAAARGWGLLLPNRDRQGADKRTLSRCAIIALAVMLAIPLLRFGPRYWTLAIGGTWNDLSIDRDSRAAAAKLRELSKPGDTLFVWGFRPDIYIDSQIPAGTRFLESQPISGVFADRHLFASDSVAPEFTSPNRRELLSTRPTWVVDGLGPYNPQLALARQDDFRDWFAQYSEITRTEFSILYRLK